MVEVPRKDARYAPGNFRWLQIGNHSALPSTATRVRLKYREESIETLVRCREAVQLTRQWPEIFARDQYFSKLINRASFFQVQCTVSSALFHATCLWIISEDCTDSSEAVCGLGVNFPPKVQIVTCSTFACRERITL